MPECPKCNLCGSERSAVVYTSQEAANTANFVYTITDGHSMKPARIVRCLDCHLMYASPTVNAQDIYAMYAGMKDETYLSEETGRRLSARIMLKRLMQFKRGGRLLDIGCAAGLLLDEAAGLGWQTAGVELSRWAAGIARSRFKLDVFNGLMEEAAYPAGSFDAVVMSDIIEHLPDPRGTLNEVERILKPDGIICVSTPDVNSFASRLLKAKWWGVNLAHLFYFSRRVLKAMLNSAGFEVIAFRSHVRIFSPDYLSARLGYYSRPLAAAFSMASRYLLKPGRLLTINIGDQIEAYARKRTPPGAPFCPAAVQERRA